MNRLKDNTVRCHAVSLLAALLCLLSLNACGSKQADVFSVSLAETEATEEADPGFGDETEEGDTQTTEAAETVTEGSAMLFVYICGEVKAPGVYELPPSSRICDAVEAAGGFTDDAATDYWNLAESLTDGEMIEVPTQEEADTRQASVGMESEAAPAASDSHYDGAGRLNLNKATVEELQQLSGIGEQKAKAIVAYREEHGDFSRTSDITNVSGIGESTYNALKDQIMVD